MAKIRRFEKGRDRWDTLQMKNVMSVWNIRAAAEVDFFSRKFLSGSGTISAIIAAERT